MESITFADILFTAVVLAITFAILFFVNKSKNKKIDNPEEASASENSDGEKASS